MIDEELGRLVGEKLSVEFEERDIALGHDYLATTSEFAKRGVFQSSMCALAVAELYTRELQIRASIALGQVKRVAGVLRVELDSQLCAGVKEFLSETIQTQSSILTELVLQRPPLKSDNWAGLNVSGEFATVLNRTHRNIEAEVDLWVASHERQSEAKAAGSVQINGAGNVGSVQTGDYASTSQTIILNGEGKEVITRALEQVAQALAKTPEAQFNVNEVKALVSECQDEIGKDQPNQMKLKSSLVGVATTIQATAALGPAYQALKGALAFFGITLP
jgi:hypothetical protein